MFVCVERLLPWIYAGMAVNVLMSLCVIVVDVFLLYQLYVKMKAINPIEEANLRFQEAIRAAEFARMPIVGILLMASFAGEKGIPRDEVIREYEKDSMERRAIVYDVFGQNSTSRRFIDRYPSQFLRNGYEGESLLLTTFNKTSVIGPSKQ
ncbi:hypothetical protein M3Y94_01236500 [Aphelenchoides besseyi]|nr:hypothetical protein M3Y94_01236500 [Aphelenchoides besseyi]KAI6217520.1 hypothetical protein M3Y95_01212400 [Aphelenchoides besseyi]